MDEITLVNEIEDTSNIILIASPNIPIEKIVNLDREIIFCTFTFEVNNAMNNLVHFEHRHYHKLLTPRFLSIKKRDPIEMIDTLTPDKIKDYINNLFYFLTRPSYIGSNKLEFSLFIYKKDIDRLYNKKERLLTARLANLIYKISTLRFDDSNTKIGLYYYNTLGIHSKTVKLYHITIGKKERRSTRVYDLNDISLQDLY